jgi:hypothetical protein
LRTAENSETNSDKVYGSQARRAKGTTAHWMWLMETSAIFASIQVCPPAARLRFLAEVLRFSRSQKQTDGIEPVIASALNAAWAWLSPDTARYLIGVVTEELRRSEYAQAHSIPVFDPTIRSVTVYEPREILNVDTTSAIIENYVHQVPHIGGPPPGDPNFRGRGGFDPTGRSGFDPTGRGGFDPTGRGGFDPTGRGGFDPNGRGGFDPTGLGGFDPR